MLSTNRWESLLGCSVEPAPVIKVWAAKTKHVIADRKGRKAKKRQSICELLYTHLKNVYPLWAGRGDFIVLLSGAGLGTKRSLVLQRDLDVLVAAKKIEEHAVYIKKVCYKRYRYVATDWLAHKTPRLIKQAK